MAKTLYIIDGHALIYAAFYAPIGGNLTTLDGEPTKATLIFTTMLLKVLRERQPDMLAVTMDSPGPTFRHEMYDQYKANRPPMPEDLRPQIDRITQIIQAMRIPVLRVSGYEADDIIGTLAREASCKEYDVLICSKDKDMEQLLDDHVAMYDIKSGNVTDVQALFEKKGIKPGQVIDILALQGDTSDNIPGVPDVGPKTALQWIQKYDSLDGLLENKDQIKGKRGDNLRANIEQLQLSRQLATINRQSPVEIDWLELNVKPFDHIALKALFEELGFRKLVKQLDEIAQVATPEPTFTLTSVPTSTPTSAVRHTTTDEPPIQQQSQAKAEYQLIDTPELFTTFLAELSEQSIFAIDTETTGINPVAAELVGLSFAWQANRAFYLPVKAPLGLKCLDWREIREKLMGILVNPDIKKIGQNIKYDVIILERAGVELQGIAFDTMVASYVLAPGRIHHSLDSMAMDYLGHETIKLETIIGKGKKQLTFDQAHTQIAADYAAEDADITWQLYEFLSPRFTDERLTKLFNDVEMPLLQVLARMENNGVSLDIHWLKKMSSQISRRLEKLTEDIHKEAGCEFNIDSPKQLATVLFIKIGLTPVKKTKSGASTDQEVLQSLAGQHPVPSLMLEYRKLSKLKNTYIDKLPAMICNATNRVHASFNQTTTATGRLSSSNPNMQNIPIRSELGQEIRKAFVPGDKGNVILAADYSQIELRFLAHFCQDEGLLEAFRSGQDIHRFVASQVYDITVDEVNAKQRSKAKAVNFGLIYGQTAYGLSKSINMTVAEAQEFIDDYFARYPAIKTFIQSVISQAKKDSSVCTILGKRRPIIDLNSRNVSRRRLAERMAVNTVVQGSAADMIKLAMINLDRLIRKELSDMKMLLQVHDELVFELPAERVEEYSGVIRKEMTGAMELRVPITVDIGYGCNWLECK